MSGDFVVDNSVVMAWCFHDEETQYSMKVLSMLERATAHVPSIWPLEASNVLVYAERRGRINKNDTRRIIDLLNDLPIVIESETSLRVFGEILQHAREFKLSVYDATYLDLSLKMSLPLATLDVDLRKAAKNCGIRLI